MKGYLEPTLVAEGRGDYFGAVFQYEIPKTFRFTRCEGCGLSYFKHDVHIWEHSLS